MALEKVKKISLSKAMESLKKQYGQETIFKGDENISIEVETISSGCLAFDVALQVGGIPVGRIIEISGKEASGKTVFTAAITAEFQRQGRKVCFIDGEHAADRKWFESIGINWDELIFAQPSTLEQALDIMDTLASTGEVSLIIYDSVPSLPSESEANHSAGFVGVGGLSKVLSPALRKLTPVLAKNKCTAIFINQIRDTISINGAPVYGSPEHSPGGRALKHFASLRLKMTKVGGSDIKSGTQVIGHRVKIKSLKNKLSPAQGAEATFVLHYTSGIDRVQDAIETAIAAKVIERPNSKTYVFGEIKVTGREAFLEALKQNEKLLSTVVAATQEKVRKGEVRFDLDAEEDTEE